MGWRQIGTVALLVTAASAAAAAERNGGLAFETLKDAHDRQRAEGFRDRQAGRALIRQERAAPLGDSRVHPAPPPRGYTTQPQSDPAGLHSLQ